MRRIKIDETDYIIKFKYDDHSLEFACSPTDWEVYEARQAILDGDISEKAVDRLYWAVREQVNEENKYD